MKLYINVRQKEESASHSAVQRSFGTSIRGSIMASCPCDSATTSQSQQRVLKELITFHKSEHEVESRRHNFHYCEAILVSHSEAVTSVSYVGRHFATDILLPEGICQRNLGVQLSAWAGRRSFQPPGSLGILPPP